MSEVTRKNICIYLENVYQQMLESYDDIIINEIIVIIERIKRDSSITTVRSSVNDLQVICNVLNNKYHDDDCVIEFQLRINQLAELFGVDFVVDND